MAKGTVTGVAKGTADIKINYGGCSADLSGTVTIATISKTPKDYITLPGKQLSGFTFYGGSYTQYIPLISGATGVINAPQQSSSTSTKGVTITDWATYDNATDTYYLSGLKNTATVSSSNTNAVTVVVSGNATQSNITITGKAPTTTTSPNTGVGSATISLNDPGSIVNPIKSYLVRLTTEGSKALGLGNLAFESGDSNIFSVSNNSTITPLKNGSATLYIKPTSYNGGNVRKSFGMVTVYTPVIQGLPSSGSLGITRPRGALSSVTIPTGGSAAMTIKVNGTGSITKPSKVQANYGSNTDGLATFSYSGFKYTPGISSTDTSVATVSTNTGSGYFSITAKKAGSATVTMTDGNYSIKSQSISVSNQSLAEDITNNSSLTYTSSNTGIATISGTTVTGKKDGTAYIRATYGGKTCNLTGSVTVLATSATADVGALTLAITRAKNSTVNYITSVTGGAINSGFAWMGGSMYLTSQPTSISLQYGNNNGTGTISYVNFYNIPTTTTSSSNIATVSSTGSTVAGTGSVSVTGKAPGTATITLTDGTITDATKKTVTVAVTDAPNTGTVTSGWTYASSNTGVFTVNSSTGAMTTVAPGTGVLQIVYGGKTYNWKSIQVGNGNNNASCSISSTSISRTANKSLSSISVTTGSSMNIPSSQSNIAITKPTSITATYVASSYNNGTTTLSYSNFRNQPVIKSSNTGVVTVGTLGSTSCTLTGIAAGTSTITVSDGDRTVATYNITVTNVFNASDKNATIYSGWTYASSNTGVFTVNSSTGAVTTTSTAGSGYITVNYGGKSANYMSITNYAVTVTGTTTTAATLREGIRALEISGGGYQSTPNLVFETNALGKNTSKLINKATRIKVTYNEAYDSKTLVYSYSGFKNTPTVTVTNSNNGAYDGSWHVLEAPIKAESGNFILRVHVGRNNFISWTNYKELPSQTATVTVKDGNYVVKTYTVTCNSVGSKTYSDSGLHTRTRYWVNNNPTDSTDPLGSTRLGYIIAGGSRTGEFRFCGNNITDIQDGSKGYRYSQINVYIEDEFGYERAEPFCRCGVAGSGWDASDDTLPTGVPAPSTSDTISYNSSITIPNWDYHDSSSTNR